MAGVPGGPLAYHYGRQTDKEAASAAANDVKITDPFLLSPSGPTWILPFPVGTTRRGDERQLHQRKREKQESIIVF